MTPRPESRLSELESEMSLQKARIREFADDTAEGLRAIYQHVDQGFDQAHAFVQERFEEIGQRFDKLETRIDALSADVNELKISQSKQNQKLDQILELLQQK
jgi:uncharacterized coiled-coil protein SlyX